MECPAHVKVLLESLADNAHYCRFVKAVLNEEFEKMSVDITTQEFKNAFSYVESDSDTTAILDYIKEL